VELVIRNKSSGFLYKLALAGLLLSGAAFTNLVQAQLVQVKGPANGLAVMSQSELPPQGRDTYEKIQQGGPFAYEKDGVVFGNRERLLPSHKRGYYREYTVKTPGSRDRGARRIVCGGKATAPDACYYTADHYSSFRKIVP
jgi:ribonuclease T1